MIDRTVHCFLKNKYLPGAVSGIATLAGFTTLAITYKGSSCKLLGTGLYFVYKMTLFLRSRDKMEDLLLADRTRDLGYIQGELIRCIHQHHMTLQQIETVLRQNQCYTYLIARRRNNTHTDHLRFIFPGEEREKTHFLFISIRDQPEALAELLTESPTYKENFDKLQDTGFIQLREDVAVLDQFRDGTLALTPHGLRRVLEEEIQDSPEPQRKSNEVD